MNTILKRLYQLSEPELFSLSEAIDVELQRRGCDGRSPGFRPAAGRGTSTKLSAAHRFDGPAHQGCGFAQARSATCGLSAPRPIRGQSFSFWRAP